MALTLNGTSQSLWTPSPFKSMPCSYSIWINCSNITPTRAVFGQFATGGGAALMFYSSAGHILEESVPDIHSAPRTLVRSVGTIANSTWHHVVCVFSSTTLRVLYLDGVPLTDTNSSNPTLAIMDRLSVGGSYFGTPTAGELFPGTVAYPCLWNTSVTQADVTAMYNGGSGSDPRLIQPGFMKSYLQLGVSNTYLDGVTGLTWTNVGSSVQAADPFVVGNGTPVMSVQGASLVTTTTATLNGTLVVTRGSNPVLEGFNYGLDTSYGTSPAPLSGSFTPGAFSIPITGLTPATIYHFQSMAINSVGTGVSTDEYFTTAAVGIPLGQPAPDVRFGYATHFDQQSASPNYNPTTVIPSIAKTGAGWIRDDMNWQFIERAGVGRGQGFYDPTAIKPFWNLATANGLGIIAIIAGNAGNTLYTNNYDPTAMANFCVWLVGQLPTVVLEILNEPNNNYRNYIGNATWQAAIVTLTNTVRAAVHAVYPATQVIGYGAQGQQILTMLANGGLADGIVYHPYDLNDEIPEHCYEPPYLNYDNWVRTLRSFTSTPIWETEHNGVIVANDGLVVSEYDQALWNSRRILQSFGLGVEHTIIYQYTDGQQQSVVDYYLSPRQTSYVVQKLLLGLAGMVGTLEPVVLSNLSAGFDSADVMTYTYRSATSTAVAIWLGNNPTNQSPASGTATVSFKLLNTNVTGSILDTLVGTYTPLANYATQTVGSTLSVSGVAISDVPQLITVSGVTVASAPVVSIIFGATNVAVTTSTLNASITFDGGSPSTVTGFHYGLTTAYGLTASTTAVLDTGPFSNNITGLQAATAYHYQAFATNATGTGTSVDSVFMTNAPPTPPVVSVNPGASNITSTTVDVSGSITSDGGSSSSVTGFNYGLTTSYGGIVSTTAVLDTGPFSNTITGLLPSSTYHFQAFATNATGTGNSLDSTFLTAVTTSSPILSSILGATNITSTSATLNASITSDGGSSSTVTGFNYGLTTSYGGTVIITSTLDTGPFSNTIGGLSASTIYHFQAFATNATGTGVSVDATFVTGAINSAPIFSSILSASNVTATTAILNASIMFDGGAPSTVTGFNYGLTTAYSATVIGTSIVDTGPFSNTITGLSAATTYHFQAFATNAAGTGTSVDATFVTGFIMSAPIISNVLGASNITSTTAGLNASIVADGGSPSTVTGFHYGLTPTYGLTISSTSTLDIGPFSNTITGLLPSSTYHFQAFATNATGTGTSIDGTFLTTAATSSPSISNILGATNITALSVTLNGSIVSDGGSSSIVTGFNYGLTRAYGSTVSISSGLDTGPFSNTITGLSASTIYHFQAFATNATGTGVSVDATFITSNAVTGPLFLLSPETSSLVGGSAVERKSREFRSREVQGLPLPQKSGAKAPFGPQALPKPL